MKKCFAATTNGSLIRTIAKNDSRDSALLTSDLILEGAMKFENAAFYHCGSFILPTLDLTNKRRLYETKTEGIISLIQSVTLLTYCIIKTNAGIIFQPTVFSDTSGEDDALVRLLLGMKDYR